MSLFDRIGNVVKAEWSSRFGEGDDDGDDAGAKETKAEKREAAKQAKAEVEEALRRPHAHAQAKSGPPSASRPRSPVTDLESAFRVLEVRPGATLDEVRAAYRALAQRYHPRTLSKVPDHAYAAQTVLDALTEALEVLEAHLLPLPSGRGT